MTKVTSRSFIESYIKRKDPELQKVIVALCKMVKKALPLVKETVNPWHIPTFEYNGPMCYFSAGKNHVTFGFLRGSSPKDPDRLLEGTGKGLRHVKLRSAEDVAN